MFDYNKFCRINKPVKILNYYNKDEVRCHQTALPEGRRERTAPCKGVSPEGTGTVGSSLLREPGKEHAIWRRSTGASAGLGSTMPATLRSCFWPRYRDPVPVQRLSKQGHDQSVTWLPIHRPLTATAAQGSRPGSTNAITSHGQNSAQTCVSRGKREPCGRVKTTRTPPCTTSRV